MIRLRIAAASEVVRAGLAALLRAEPGIEVIGVTSLTPPFQADGIEADILLLDLEQAELPPEWAGVVEDTGPAVLVLADPLHTAEAMELLRSGVRGLLPRTAGTAEIVAALPALAAGLTILAPAFVNALLTRPAASRSAAAIASGSAPLTPRETEVLQMLAEGLGNKEIAWRLGISEHTVKFHVSAVMAKLHAGSRTEAVAHGLRAGLVLL